MKTLTVGDLKTFLAEVPDHWLIAVPHGYDDDAWVLGSGVEFKTPTELVQDSFGTIIPCLNEVVVIA